VPFSNLTSFVFAWFTDAPDRANWTASTDDDTRRTLVIGDHEGGATVGAQLEQYDTAVLRSVRASVPATLDTEEGSVLRREYQLRLVRNVELTPSRPVLLYRQVRADTERAHATTVHDGSPQAPAASPMSTMTLRASGGSGSYRFTLSDADAITNTLGSAHTITSRVLKLVHSTGDDFAVISPVGK
jgi:hypothetical protein